MIRADSGLTRVVFLGGLGEIGRNMIALECGGRVLIIDAGLSFPNDEMLGVDLVLPDFTWLVERRDSCEAVVLTHGHEDHVGALSWLLREIDVPVYGTPVTLGIARRRLDESEVDADLRTVSDAEELTLGPFRCRFLPVSHSIPDAVAVAVDSPGGRLLYTGDFKIDSAPIDGRRTDLDDFAALGREGVDLLLSDSTNALTPGRTPSESIVGETFRSLFKAAGGRIIVACFASNLHRIQQVCEAAENSGRKVALIGRSMIANAEVGRELGHLNVRDDTLVDAEEIGDLRPHEVVVICTGSQGEPLSALSLIAAGAHKFFRIQPGDTVILSASAIPGNEAAVHRVVNALYREGAEVFDGERSAVHVSGHAAADELAEMLRVVRPRHFVPVHGEYRHLAAHARIAEDAGVDRADMTIVEDGDVIEMRAGKISVGESVAAGMILVDGLGVGDVGNAVLRERGKLSEEGICVALVQIDQHSRVVEMPQVFQQGVIYEREQGDLLELAAKALQAELEAVSSGDGDPATMRRTVSAALGRFWRDRTGRRPVILPILVEM